MAALTLTAQATTLELATEDDRGMEAFYAEREADWRNGAIVYQVLVDRFAPPANIAAKAKDYPAPKKLREWSEVPRPGQFVPEANVWSHEIDFWGGDFASMITRLDYIKDFGATTVYLNPIHLAYTNHKYDAQDYFGISPEFGTRKDLQKLSDEIRARGMKLVLDGVFNHMGRTSPIFQEALKNPASEWRGWFVFGPQFELGYRAWYNVANLPEVNLENPAVRARIYGDPDSVVQGYLKDIADGWRLDVAYDIGPKYLGELTRAAHEARPGSLVVGEIWNAPAPWVPEMDAIMSFTVRELIIRTVKGDLPVVRAQRLLTEALIAMPEDNALKSWLLLDNHDVPRLRHVLPEEAHQRLAQVLQFTLPGSPNVYYGTELGMEGGGDPENRAPMRWDLNTPENPYAVWMKKLVTLRQNHRALRIGRYQPLESTTLMAFLRSTNRVNDTVLVLINPAAEERRETLFLPDGKLMDGQNFGDQLGAAEFTLRAGILDVAVPAKSAMVLTPKTTQTDKGYFRSKRVY